MRGQLLQGALVLGVLLASKHGRASAIATDVQNVTLQNTESELLYIPELCVTSDGDCEGGWTVVDLPESSNGSVTSTNGPIEQDGNILPQVYLTFRGSAVFVKTSDVSNATANLTVSSQPSGTLESRVFTPSRDFWAFKGLDESQLTTVVVTFLPGSDSTRLDIDFIKISVSNASASTSFLPSQTIPPSAFTPSIASVMTLSTSSPTVLAQSRQSTGAIVGETFAGFITVLLTVTFTIYFFWRRYRRKRDEERRKAIMTRQAAQQVLSMAPRGAEHLT